MKPAIKKYKVGDPLTVLAFEFSKEWCAPFLSNGASTLVECGRGKVEALMAATPESGLIGVWEIRAGEKAETYWLYSEEDVQENDWCFTSLKFDELNRIHKSHVEQVAYGEVAPDPNTPKLSLKDRKDVI